MQDQHTLPRPGDPVDSVDPVDPVDVAAPAGEEGSLVAEYGLLAIVGATIASIVMKWASGGAIWELFGALTDKVRALIGA